MFHRSCPFRPLLKSGEIKLDFWTNISPRIRKVILRREKPALYPLATWRLRMLMGK